ncbi:MAG TPA: GspE/PulE family protein [Pyrinomonadaceae bacterium]|nr:type II/IV secretion system protein [Chloracidobacterium sp.]HQX57214.1 GspE/PulE family protein [Pyrinomonadaceae bacterium]MBK7803659.1 type II/IV secretion system protein [Chloracidobacterium sp.]MBL0239060.1 type II/IV secretion system protein [Chloracidobacterium sp.]HQY67330.1 GspE/PulE family protein [Pyrinomonadaceae bacterium]
MSSEVSTTTSLPKIELTDFLENEPPEVLEAKELARRYRMPYVDLLPPDKSSPVDQVELSKIPVDLMLRNQIVPLKRDGNNLYVAMADPTNLERLDELENVLNVRIVPHVSTAGAIDVVLKKGDATQRVMAEAASSFKISLVKETDQGDEVLDLDRLANDSEMSPIIKLVDTVLYNAMESRASDIHIETRERDVQVKFRIDGALYAKVDPIDIAYHQTLISRIKVMSELDIAERRIPQDGRFRVRYKGRTVDFRVSIMPTVFGEDAVIRILDKEQINESFKNLDLDVVGFDDEDVRRFRLYIKEPYGMVLVTGPTGSGKTTTLYAALNEIRNDEDKIITIEDPVEYQLHGIVQIPVNEKKGLTFARGLRSILRHDPDKIMVGEIRDEETAQIAIQSALTGHLVFTTVHANNVIDVIGRFLNMGVEPYNFVSSLNCVLAQRLVRLLCPICKRPYQPTEDELIESGMRPEDVGDRSFYRNVGCDACNHTGYRGRSAIHELLDMSDNIREMIIERRPGSEIRRQAEKEGLSSLRESAVKKVFAGQTTLYEINRVTFVEEIKG